VPGNVRHSIDHKSKTKWCHTSGGPRGCSVGQLPQSLAPPWYKCAPFWRV